MLNSADENTMTQAHAVANTATARTSSLQTAGIQLTIRKVATRRNRLIATTDALLHTQALLCTNRFHYKKERYTCTLGLCVVWQNSDTNNSSGGTSADFQLSDQDDFRVFYA